MLVALRGSKIAPPPGNLGQLTFDCTRHSVSISRSVVNCKLQLLLLYPVRVCAHLSTCASQSMLSSGLVMQEHCLYHSNRLSCELHSLRQVRYSSRRHLAAFRSGQPDTTDYLTGELNTRLCASQQRPMSYLEELFGLKGKTAL